MPQTKVMPLAAKSALNHQLSDSENLDKIFGSFLMIYDIIISWH